MNAAESSRLHDAIRETACCMWNRGAGPGLILRAFEEGHGRGLEKRNSGSC